MAMDYTKEERTAIDEIKKRMKGIIEEELYDDDDIFYRFLKARDFNYDKTEFMMKEYAQWRKKYDVKNIFNYKPQEILLKHMPFNHLGHDRDGCILYFLPGGNIDWIGIYNLVKLDDICKYLIQITERDIKNLKKYREETGKTAGKIIYILDLKNLSFAQCTHKKVVFNILFFLNFYQNNFPEILKNMTFINAPSYFTLVYSLIQKILPTTITNKLKAFSDEELWKEYILKTVDAEQLPAFLGGTKTDPDGNPFCLTFTNHSAPIPEEYFENKKKKMLSKAPDVEKVTIGRAAFHEVFIEVKEPDSLLEWEFETKSRDVGFGLFYDDGQGNKSEIIPIQRVSADEFSESGVCSCDKAGTYIVLFDNTYSLLRKKDLFYKISVIKPGEELSPVK